MGNNGPSYKLQKVSHFSQVIGPFKHFEVQQVTKEKITTMPRVRNVWIPIDIGIRNWCSQFYVPESDSNIKEGNCIMRISSFGKDFHMLCWFYCTDLYYGDFSWKYASRSDMDYNIRVSSNRL